MTRRFWGTVLILLASLAPQGLGQGGAKVAPGSAGEGLDWAHDVASAFRTAVEKKRPVLFVIMKDREIGCSRMLDGAYRDPKVRERLAQFVLVPCSTYAHVVPETTQEGKLVHPCPQFPGVTCAEHQLCEREMRTRYQDADTVVAPQHLVCDPEGKMLARKLYEMKTTGFIDFLDHALVTFRGGTESKPASGDPAADAPKPADGAPAKPAMPADVEGLYNRILKGEPADKEAATKDLLGIATPQRVDAYLEALKNLKASKDRGTVVRAAGYPEYSAAAEKLAALLTDKDSYVRNCVVVTLEEMANPAVAAKLLDLLKTEKEPEIHKDLVRALGPCGGGKSDVQTVLIHELSNSVENVRAGAAMSLGYFIPISQDVKKELKARWAKDGNSLKVKTAILWGVTLSNDGGQASFIDELIADENNAQVKKVAELAKGKLKGDPMGGGPGGGGGGGRHGAGGGRGGFMKLLQPLFADDKIVRNRVKELLQREKP